MLNVLELFKVDSGRQIDHPDLKDRIIGRRILRCYIPSHIKCTCIGYQNIYGS